MMTEVIKKFHELWEQDEQERLEAIGELKEEEEEEMTKEQMLDKLVAKLGMEHRVVINFANLMQNSTDEQMKIVFDIVQEYLPFWL